MPNMAGDGMNPLNLSMEIDEKINKTSVAGKQGKTNRIERQPKNVPKVDSDLEIVAELSGDSDGLKFQKPLCASGKQTVESDSDIKTTIESSEDDLDSDIERRRLVVMSNIPEKKKIESVAKKLQKTEKNGKKRQEKRGQGPPKGKQYARSGENTKNSCTDGGNQVNLLICLTCR